MKRKERNNDWLKGFKRTVALARDARLIGNMPHACHLDRTIESYYAESSAYGFDEDTLVEAESAIRNPLSADQ